MIPFVLRLRVETAINKLDIHLRWNIYFRRDCRLMKTNDVRVMQNRRIIQWHIS